MNFIKKIFSPIFILISISLLIYTIYRSEFFWEGTRRNHYIFYYFLSLFLIIFSIGTFYIKQKFKEYLIISMISIGVSLYLFEGYLSLNKQVFSNQVFKNQTLKEKLYEKQTGKKWDKRTIFQIYKDLKKTNKNTVIDIGKEFFVIENISIFTLSALENSLTLFCNENGYYSSYISDRFGFNNPDEEWEKKEVEYLLVGDSFSHGLCVNRPYDIASVLRNISNKAVLNLGYRGNGPLAEYATLREYLNSNVRNVLWIYYEGNDLIDLDTEIKNKVLYSYIDDINFSQNLKSKIKILNQKKKISHKYLENISKNKIQNFLKLYNLRLFLKTKIYINKFNSNSASNLSANSRLNELKKILRLARDLVYENDSEFYFVYLPEYNRFINNYDNTNYNSVKNIVDELGISFIDINKEVFEKEENPLRLFPFEKFGHYNIEGYKKVAIAINKFFKK
tara:strand:- start:463 stop:1812 length:1350 start_codon:yes stop_codon:yes gene_type:complete